MRKQKEVLVRTLQDVSEYDQMVQVPYKLPTGQLVEKILEITGWDGRRIFSKSKVKELVFRRGIIDLIVTSNGCSIYQCAKDTRRDHTTVIHSLRSIENQLDEDRYSRRVLGEIVALIREDFELKKGV